MHRYCKKSHLYKILLLIWFVSFSHSAFAQDRAAQSPLPPSGQGQEREAAHGSPDPSVSPVSDSRFDGSFSRTGGARFFIALTPFAMTMALLVLLLILLIPILIRAGYKKANRGYFKTIAHG